MVRPRDGTLQFGGSLLKMTKPGQAFGETTEELGIAPVPTRLLAGFQWLRYQLNTPSEFATFDEQLSFPAGCHHLPQGCIRPCRPVAQRRNGRLRSGEITPHESD